MQRHVYSVFLGNLGSCADRYCEAYGRSFTVEELFERAASIPQIGGVDLVLTPRLIEDWQRVVDSVKRCKLKVVSLAVDTFADGVWKNGSFSSSVPAVFHKAVDDGCRAMDLAAEVGCDLITIWPGQDGYDYLFQADYVAERTRFADGIRTVCRHRPDIRVSLEYKPKEPRTHCYVNTVGTTLMMLQEINEPNAGAALDFGHALIGYENPAESAALLDKYGRKLFHIHINDNYRSWDDDMIVGTVHTLEYLEFLIQLRRIGYEGWMTIDQYPYREDGRDAVCESALWLEALQTVAERADLNEVAQVQASRSAVAASELMRKLLFGHN